MDISFTHTKKYRYAIWWIKRDMRLSDNMALVTALAESQFVLPVFICEPSVMQAEETSPLHIHMQFTALTALRNQLKRMGSDLCVLHGEAVDVLADLRSRYPFRAIYSHQETGSNVTYMRDIQTGIWCRKTGIIWNEYAQNAVLRGKRLEKVSKTYFGKFMEQKELPPITALAWNEFMQKVCYTPIPKLSHMVAKQKVQPVTEESGARVLDSFLTERGETYWGSLSRPNTAWFHGSRLSPHLAWGTLSLRTVFQAAQRRAATSTSFKWQRSLEAFSARLYWHDHFMQKLESFPEYEFHTADPRYENLTYDGSNHALTRWLAGETGFPLVDATMRCLAETGFINFRMRAMVISFATYGLHLSWRDTLYPFARLMADYEPGIHIYQVQMQSGVTKGSAMRSYNPGKQLFEKDTDCTFVKKWVPELASFSPTDIYRMVMEHEKYGNTTQRLGNYPAPMVHFAKTSQEMKDRLVACTKEKVAYLASQQLTFLSI